jgi:hypothetical protein
LRQSETAAIRAAAVAGRTAEAQIALATLIGRLFSLDATAVRINQDQYSLNSLNGFFESAGQKYFFKFHQEDGEEAMAGEYYRADILLRAGLPADMPVHMSALPGEQILIYRRRDDPRFSDILRALDFDDDAAARAAALAAETQLSRQILKLYQDSLHEITPAQAAAEPIHHLFHERLVDPETKIFPGGRYQKFYSGHIVRLPKVDLGWEDFSSRRFTINGVRYRQTIAELFHAAATALHPNALANAGGVIAHGDAHNANVWYSGAKLIFFDPAFAGAHVPALLAEVKATFHNIFAHPFWLYDPDIATAKFYASVTAPAGGIIIETDWHSSPIRRDLLAVKAAQIWRPWLRSLRERGMLPENWRDIVKLALFLCPTLVMNLREGNHTPTSTAIAFAVAVMAGATPDGRDVFGDFFDSIAP